MEDKVKLPPMVAEIAIGLAREQAKVNYGSVAAKVISVGGVPTSVIFAATQKIRFHGANNKGLWAKVADVVNCLPAKGKSEAGFKIAAEDGVVRELTIETTESVYFAKKDEGKSVAKSSKNEKPA